MAGNPIKITARQRKFLELASDPEGLCPWDMPPRSPILRSHEIVPLIDAALCVFSKEFDVWVTTPSGKGAIRAGQFHEKEKS